MRGWRTMIAVAAMALTSCGGGGASKAAFVPPTDENALIARNYTVTPILRWGWSPVDDLTAIRWRTPADPLATDDADLWPSDDADAPPAGGIIQVYAEATTGELYEGSLYYAPPDRLWAITPDALTP